MNHLVNAYLQYLQYDDGEMRSCLEPLDEPLGTLEVEVIDDFCECFTISNLNRPLIYPD